MTRNIKRNTIKFLLVSTAALFVASCGKLEALKNKNEALEARLKVAIENAQYAFKAGLGEIYCPGKTSDGTVGFKTKTLAAYWKVGRQEEEDTLEDLNDAIKEELYENGDKSKEKYATGALAAFFYPLYDKLLDGEKKDSCMWVSLLGIILECKETLEQLVEKPSDYTPDKLEKILNDCEQKMKAAPELEIAKIEDKDTLKEKDGGSPQDHYKEPGVKEAFEAFKEEVKKLQEDYERVLGIQKEKEDDGKRCYQADFVVGFQRFCK